MRLKKLALSILPFVAVSTIYAQSTSLVEKPWLRDHVPSAITAYVRIPNPKFYFTDNETPLKSLYQNPLYNQFMSLSVQSILTQVQGANVSQEAKKIADVLLSKLVAPIEVMVSEFSDMSVPPSLLIATKLNYQDGASFSKDFSALTHQTSLQIKPTSDTTGQIILKQRGITAQYEFNPENHRLLIALEAKPAAFKKLMNTNDKSSDSAIALAESKIDAGGNGLFVWLYPNPQLLKQLPIDPKKRQIIDALKIDQAEFIAAGFGLGDGRPKIKALVKMPNIGLRQLFPSHENTANPEYFGELSSVYSLSLPNEKQLDNIVSFVMVDKPAEQLQYTAGKENMKARLGVDFSNAMKLIGQQIVSFEDDNGSFMAIPASAELALDTFLLELIEKGVPIKHDEMVVDGQTIHHLSLQELLSKAMEKQSKSLSSRQKMLMPLISQMYLPSNHYYWIKEKDALIFSTLPQPLIARQKGTAKGTLSDWLQSQKVTIDGSTLSFVGNFRNLSQKSYYGQLSLLQLLSDVSGTPLSIEKFPAANTLSLPRHSTLALQVHNHEDMLSIEYSAENGLLDMWYCADSKVVIASTGILAAIAIPAYQQYIERAKAVRLKAEKQAQNAVPSK